MASPAILGNNTVFTYQGQDLSGDMNQVKINMNQPELDVSVFGITGWREYIANICDATIDITGFFDKVSNKQDSILFGQFGAPLVPQAFLLDIPNASSGSVRYTGNAFIRTYVPDSKVNDAVKFTASLRVTGALTRATI